MADLVKLHRPVALYATVRQATLDCDVNQLLINVP